MDAVNWLAASLVLGVLAVLLLLVQMVLNARLRSEVARQKAMLDWVDEREAMLVPLVRYAAAIHSGGAPQHQLADVSGVPTVVEVPVPGVDPAALPEGKNWVVRGDTVYEARPSVIPSRGGMDQIFLLMEMERERRSLIQPLREAWVALSEWERKNPVPS